MPKRKKKNKKTRKEKINFKATGTEG